MPPSVPNYKHDIFISYTQVDNQPAPGADKGWVSTLADGLRKLLAQKLGREDAFSLWMDIPSLSRHNAVTPEIENTLRETAILLVILSPGYLASEWCRQERETFLAAIGGQPGSRLFMVEYTETEYSEKPDVFRELLGYRFWGQDGESRSPRTLGYPEPNPSDSEDKPYYNLLSDLAGDLAKELKRLNPPPEAPAVQEAMPDTRPAVFLADVTPDLFTKRDEVRRYLELEGFRVLPDKPLFSTDTDAFRQAVDEELKDCKAFVQLLSNLPFKLHPDLPCHCQIQYECASKAKKPILQWCDPELDMSAIRDADHRKLLERNTVLATHLEDFKRELVTQVRKLMKRESSRAMQKAASTDALVFLNAHKEDDSLADEISGVMDENSVGYVLPIWDGEGSEIQKDFEDNLTACDGVIVIYGLVSVLWARQQLRECRKVMSRREKPLKALAVYEGPPENKQALKIKLPNMLTLNCRTCLREKEIQTFLDALGKGGDA